MLNISSAFATKNNVLQKILGQYVSLGLLKLTEDEFETYTLALFLGAGANWYFDEKKWILYISDSPAVSTAMATCAAADLKTSGGTNLRVKIERTISPPEPPNFEWILQTSGNRTDNTVVV